MKRKKTTSIAFRHTKAAVCLLGLIFALAVMAGGCYFLPASSTDAGENLATEPPVTEETQPPRDWETGYIAASNLSAAFCDEDGVAFHPLLRGTRVEYALLPDGKTEIRANGQIGDQRGGAYVVPDLADCIPTHTLYVRSTVNLRDQDGKLLPTLAEKGQSVYVTGCDYLQEDGAAHMYRVRLDGAEG